MNKQHSLNWELFGTRGARKNDDNLMCAQKRGNFLLALNLFAFILTQHVFLVRLADVVVVVVAFLLAAAA